MPEVELEKDIDKLERYQAESLIGQLGALELHLQDISEGKEAGFCKSCVEQKHVPLIKTLASECLSCQGVVWSQLSQWASDFNLSEGPLALAREARDFRKKLGGILRSHDKENPVGDKKMTQKRGVEFPDFGDFGSVENPGKTEQTKQKVKKGSSLLPWVVGAGLALGGWLLYQKKKKAEAEARQREQGLLTQQEEAQKGGPGPVESQFSASDRLKGMGIDPTKPAHYQQPGDKYAG